VLTKIQSRESVCGSLHRQSRRTAFQLLAGQTLVAVTISIVLMVAFGSQVAYAALVGAFIGIVPNWHLADRMLRPNRNVGPEQLLRQIYFGEFIKIAFTVALFVMTIVLLDVSFLVVIGVYLAIVAVNWMLLPIVDLSELPRNRVMGDPVRLRKQRTGIG